MKHLTPGRWNLVADVGGTNARFGVEDYASSEIRVVRHYSVAEHSNLNEAVLHFLDDINDLEVWSEFPEAACVAVACAVESDVLQFTNSPWTVNANELAAILGDIKVELINDFAAVGYAVGDLKPQDWHQLGPGSPQPGRPIVVLGPGTGLGVCTLVPIGSGYQVIEGEGGHVDFAPVDSQELEVLRLLTSRFGRVSVERLLSGEGILNIYQALTSLAGGEAQHTSPSEVTAAAMAGSDSLALEAMEMFARVLGGAAGNLALTLGAKGGVYIAGGIVPRFLAFFENSDLRHRFESKGRFRSYLADIPLRVIVKNDMGLAGAARRLDLAER
ncbi:MAG: glucokinase [Pseudomonadales bacterium]|nr:glucokinase [Pseudomonadales bacterium]